MRERMDLQFQAWKEIFDAKIEAQSARIDALSAEINSLRRDVRLVLALLALLIALGLFSEFFNLPSTSPSASVAVEVPQAVAAEVLDPEVGVGDGASESAATEASGTSLRDDTLITPGSP